MYISWKTWPAKPNSKWSIVSHSRISSLHLANLHSCRHYQIYLFSSPLLHEGYNNRSTVHLGCDMFNPHSCNNNGRCRYYSQWTLYCHSHVKPLELIRFSYIFVNKLQCIYKITVISLLVWFNQEKKTTFYSIARWSPQELSIP